MIGGAALTEPSAIDIYTSATAVAKTGTIAQLLFGPGTPAGRLLVDTTTKLNELSQLLQVDQLSAEQRSARYEEIKAKLSDFEGTTGTLAQELHDAIRRDHVLESVESGDPNAPIKKAPPPGLSQADDGTRTHDLLHGKQTL